MRSPQLIAVQLSLVLLLSCSLAACASKRTQMTESAASQPELWREAITIIQQHALDGDKPDWKAIAAKIAAEKPSNSDVQIRAVLAAYNDPHAKLLTREEAVTWKAGAALTPEPGTESAAEAAASSEPPSAPDPAHAESAHSQPAIPEAPWSKMIQRSVAYVGLPPCNTGDPQAIQAYSHALRTQINILTSRRARWWIIDLRLNGGGNVWPMLGGLQPMLGNGVAFRSLQPHGVEQRFGCAGNTAWLEHDASRTPQFTVADVQEFVQPAVCERLAVLIGPWTMSSGEMITVALMSKPHARTFGEPTAGLTTITNFFPLSDGSILVLPTGRVAPPVGAAIVGQIQPAEIVPFGDWPLIDDATVAAALKWIHEAPAGNQR